MKNYIYILLFLLSISSFSQEEFKCGHTIPLEQIESYKQLSNSLQSNTISAKNLNVLANSATFELKIHFIRRSNETSDYNYDESDIISDIQELNSVFEAFENFSISFNYCDENNTSFINYIDEDAYYDNPIETLEWYETFYTEDSPNYDNIKDKTEVLMTKPYKENNAINIYYVPEIEGGFSGRTYIPSVIMGGGRLNHILMDYDAIGSNYTLIHEIGHYFNLLHTHERISFIGLAEPEYSERVDTEDCYNCNYSADRFCDTSPDYFPNTYYDSANCTYRNLEPNDYDPENDDCWDVNSPIYDATNYMSYYAACASTFSPEQIEEMILSAQDYAANNFFPLICNDCPLQIDISNNTLAGTIDEKSASSFIEAYNTIESNATALYHAGEEVLLTDGFVAESGSSFDGYIKGCEIETSSKSLNQTSVSDISKLAKNDVAPELNITVYPNPSTGLFNIQSMDQITSYSITNMLGSQIINNKQKGNKFTIDLTKFSDGIYFLELQKENGEIVRKRILKK